MSNDKIQNIDYLVNIKQNIRNTITKTAKIWKKENGNICLIKERKFCIMK